MAGDECNFMKNAYKELLGDSLGSNIYNGSQIGIGVSTVGSRITKLPSDVATLYKFGYGTKLVTDGAKSFSQVNQNSKLVTISTFTQSNILVTQTIIDSAKIRAGTLLIGIDGVNVWGAKDSIK